MGILDDAIREHLELKRRHGAAEEELRQQEVEALGIPSDPDSEGAHEPVDGNGGQALAEEPLEAEAPEAAVEPELDQAPEPEPAEAIEPEPEPIEPEPEPEPVAFEVPEPDAAFPEDEEAPAPSGDTPARGFEAEEEQEEHEEHPEEGEAGVEPDVLEDTPDFLQETPEHDRLWFEQKPPRDFDFD